jgi:hypothetical protein
MFTVPPVAVREMEHEAMLWRSITSPAIIATLDIGGVQLRIVL